MARAPRLREAVMRGGDNRKTNWPRTGNSRSSGAGAFTRDLLDVAPDVCPEGILLPAQQREIELKHLKKVAPREWIRTIDRTGNNRLLYR